MDDEKNWYYEKLDENGKRKRAPFHDLDGKETGRHVYMLREWFDENPDERKRLGWTKHITHKAKDIEYDRASQYLVNNVRRIDEWTVEDNWMVMDMSEEQMRLAEISLNSWDWDYDDDYYGGGVVIR